MHRQVGDLQVNEFGIACRGLMVRHLLMPGGVSGFDGVARFLAGEISPATYVNIMDQYQPYDSARWDARISRPLRRSEHLAAREAARRAGLERIG
jgi:putative pyruvate formate lyase activating enzyme